jgi:hypothetical protein
MSGADFESDADLGPARFAPAPPGAGARGAKPPPVVPPGWTRLLSTEGAAVRDAQSADAFSYSQIPEKWENPNRCRPALGLVGGTEVSLVAGNLVDLESDLHGTTRPNTKCIAGQYQPSCALGGAKPCPDVPAPITYVDKETGRRVTISTTPQNPPTCTPYRYPVPATAAPVTQASCYRNARF